MADHPVSPLTGACMCGQVRFEGNAGITGNDRLPAGLLAVGGTVVAAGFSGATGTGTLSADGRFRPKNGIVFSNYECRASSV